MNSPAVTVAAFAAFPLVVYVLLRFRRGMTGGGWDSLASRNDRRRAEDEALSSHIERTMRDATKVFPQKSQE